MSDSDEDANIPPREVCEQRCRDFAQVTGTDTALAMFYLQDREWDLESAINAFFEEVAGAPPGRASGNTHVSAGSTSGQRKQTGEEKAEAVTSEPRLKILSWNIDGLAAESLIPRTKGACQTINKEKPDVVFLQEVVPPSEEILEKMCVDYMIVPGCDDTEGYYTAIMLRSATTAYRDRRVVDFPTSVMMRNLLIVRATVKGLPFKLMTSHLESTKDHAAERKNQLRKCFQELTDSAGQENVVFGGDLNLRDKELAEIGGLPEGVVDLWEETGRRAEAQYTWDLSRNDNLRDWPGKYRPRCRFDRLYMRKSSAETRIKPVYFELVGLERLKSCGRFPSDHWGLLAHFDKIR